MHLRFTHSASVARRAGSASDPMIGVQYARWTESINTDLHSIQN